MSLRFLTAGESHGPALVGIIEGIPAGLEISLEVLHAEARRRKLGFGRGARQKIETDAAEILAGVRHGRTLGSPISMIIRNQDHGAWQTTMAVAPLEAADPRPRVLSVPRPGHADLVGGIKYNHLRDMRNVLERASARETAMRLALGTVARCLLRKLGIEVASHVLSVGTMPSDALIDMRTDGHGGVSQGVSNSVFNGMSDSAFEFCPAQLREFQTQVDESPLRCAPRCAAEPAMLDQVRAAQTRGDTLGGVFEVIVAGLPAGLGSYAQADRRLEGKLSAALMSLNAIKGVEVGLGFAAARTPGSAAHDGYEPVSRANDRAHVRGVGFLHNRSGGIDGGMSTGQNLRIRGAMKPLATLMSPLLSVSLATGESAPAHVERSDVCAVPAAAVIAESIVALAIADAVLEKFGGDSLDELKLRVEHWRSYVRE